MFPYQPFQPPYNGGNALMPGYQPNDPRMTPQIPYAQHQPFQPPMPMHMGQMPPWMAGGNSPPWMTGGGGGGLAGGSGFGAGFNPQGAGSYRLPQF